MSTLALTAVLAISSLSYAWAGSSATDLTTKAEPSAYDRLWSHATLYQDKDNPWLQEVSLLGRIHANWASEQFDVGDWSDWEARRVRAGLRVKFLKQFDLKTEVRFQPFNDSCYDGLTDAVLTWSADPAFAISVGKQLPRYTQEGAASSNELLTLERSLLANTFWVGEDNYSTGVSCSGKIGSWQYYAAALSGETDQAFGKLDAGAYGIAGLGYDFAKSLHVERAVLRADYVYNDGNKANTTTKPFSNTESISFDLKQGRHGLIANVVAGQGIGNQPDVRGLVIIPSYALTPKLELVARYTFIDSDGAGGIKPQRRYESEVPDIIGTRGDQYQAIYAGLNYYLYGHKLKLQTGIEYSQMKASSDTGAFAGWSYLTGLRFSF
jgi:phosphate-selective porin OprO/OprP